MPDNNTQTNTNTSTAATNSQAATANTQTQETATTTATTNAQETQKTDNKVQGTEQKTGGKAADNVEMLLSEDEKAADAKEGDKAKEGEQTEAEDYQDFKLPEGMSLDAEKLKESKSLMKKWGLKQEQAQEAVEYVAKMVKEQADLAAAKVNTMWADTAKEWATQTKNDKDVGGAKYKESREYALRGMKKLNPEMKALVLEGWGNNPGVFKHLVELGKNNSEDNPALSNTAAKQEPVSFEKALFGHLPGRQNNNK